MESLQLLFAVCKSLLVVVVEIYLLRSSRMVTVLRWNFVRDSNLWSNKKYNEHASSYSHKRVHWRFRTSLFILVFSFEWLN